MGRQFHISDILTITTGYLVSSRHMEGVYDILNYMTGDELFTHQIPRAMEVCVPELLKQHHDLIGVDASGLNAKTISEWIAVQEKRYGNIRNVEPLTAGMYEHRNPIIELKEMIGNKPIIIIEQGR